MKRAVAYKRNDRIIVHASSKTAAGVWMLAEPVMMADGVGSAALGEMILAALQGSEEGLPHPTSWKDIFDPVLKITGEKSWGRFIKSTRCIEVEVDGEVASLVPTKNMGAREGFVALHAKTQSCSLDRNSIGACALTAFSMSE